MTIHADIIVIVPNEADILDYWGVASIDEPISIAPCQCGRFICDGHAGADPMAIVTDDTKGRAD